jgi:DMSO/TMAO reductase YedYZ molybdopterin-dependent catalytic subunit
MPIASQQGWLTPSRLFYQRNHFEPPAARAGGWTLTVEGEVERPFQLGLWELTRLPAISLWATLECSGNKRAFFDPPAQGTPWTEGAVGNAEWGGLPLRAVLARTGVKPGSIEIRFTGLDSGRHQETGETVHFERSLPLAVALDPATLLAWRMNGEALPPEHGGPLRLIVPGWYAMASVKWLTRIEVRRQPFRGPFQVRDYVYLPERGAYDRAVPVTAGRVNSFINWPVGGSVAPPGRLTVQGLAWGGEAPVAGVAVSPDGGRTWEPAVLAGPEAPYAWRQWSCTLERLLPGELVLRSRARDADGREQPERAPWNAKGYGNNQTVPVRVMVSRSPMLALRPGPAPSPPRSGPLA